MARNDTRTDTTDLVARVLAARPDSTVAELGQATALGHSTVAKALGRLEHAHRARREPGGHAEGSQRRLPDRWHPRLPDDTASPDDQTEPAEPDLAGEPSPAAVTVENTEKIADGDTTTGPGTVQPATDEPDEHDSELPEHTPTTDDTESPATPEVGQTEPPTAETAEGSSAEPDVQQQPAEQQAATAGAPRLGHGKLRGLVRDYLRHHPDQEYGPSQLAKDLDRSAGAIANACHKLAAEGQITHTCEAPARFAWRSDT